MNLFIKKLSGLLIAGIVLFTACQSGPSPVPLPPDHLAIRANQPVQTPDGPTLLADTVSVSICPAGAACFAPNSASVRLRLSGNNASQTVRLFAWIPNYTRRSVPTPGAPDSTTVDLAGQRYKVILRDGRYADGSAKEGVPTGEAIVQVSRL